MRLKVVSLVLVLFVSVCGALAQISDEQLIEILRQHQERGSSQAEVLEDMQRKVFLYNV